MSELTGGIVEPDPEWDGTCPASISGMCLNATQGFSFVGCMDICELRPTQTGRTS